MADESLYQVLALLVLDTDGERLAVKYSSQGRKVLWPSHAEQLQFEKRIISKLPKSTGGKSETDVAIIDDNTVLFQVVNDVVICAVASPSENELIVMQLMEGLTASISSVAASGILATGITKQLVLDNLSEVYFVLDEVCDDGIIMETDEDKIIARIRMTDENEVTNQQQAEAMFQKATQSARQKLLGAVFRG